MKVPMRFRRRKLRPLAGSAGALPDDFKAPARRRRGIYLLPNLFTTAALFAGFFATVQAMNQRFEWAAVAIFTFVTSWNDFLWPSLMLHTKDGLTLPVGLAALQSFFQSDFRSVAAGVTMTVVPILLFFIVVQRYFVKGLAGAVKG